MAIGNMDLYRALKEAGASEEAAAEAAKSVAGQLPRFWALTGTLATIGALVLGTLGLQFQLVERVAVVEVQVTAVEQRVTEIGQRVTGIEQRVAGIEQHVTGIEQRVTGIEQSLAALEEQGAQRHAEILRQLELLRRERSGGEP
jgi:hypothetical protein